MTLRTATRPLPRPHRAVALALLLGTALLTACTRDAAEDTAAATPATDAAPAAPATPPADTAAAATDAPPAAPASTLSPADAPPPPGPAPVAGRDYTEIANGQTFAPAGGQIEVVEVFGYTCPHCAQFDPLLQAWKARQPTDVKVVYVAAPFGGYWVPYAKAFYAAEAMGLVEKTHTPMFRAIHLDRSMPVQPLPTDEQIAAFYAKYGANPQQFASTMSSFAVDAKMKRALQFLQRAGVEGTPSLVVAGKYRVDVGGTVTSHEEMLRIAEHLVARERAASAPAAPAAPTPPAPPAAPAAG